MAASSASMALTEGVYPPSIPNPIAVDDTIFATIFRVLNMGLSNIDKDLDCEMAASRTITR